MAAAPSVPAGPAAPAGQGEQGASGRFDCRHQYAPCMRGRGPRSRPASAYGCFSRLIRLAVCSSNAAAARSSRLSVTATSGSDKAAGQEGSMRYVAWDRLACCSLVVLAALRVREPMGEG
jgi:hypothetical protein